MERIVIKPRQNYEEKLKSVGFQFYQDYWLENAYYRFSMAEIEELEKATNECYDMYCQATEACLYDDVKLNMLCIPNEMREAIRRSWEEDDLSLYGRFDFAWVNGVPKLLEFNADTPTTLIESALVQWQWKEDVFPDADQFNSIHEALIQSWKDIHEVYKCDTYYFGSLVDCLEDNSTTEYIQHTAIQAGLHTVAMDFEDLVYQNGSLYCGTEPVNCMFKLYPLETMFHKCMEACKTEMCWIEPLWKALMSNKAMLPILYEMFPDSPYILPAYREEDKAKLRSYCKKPIFSREGANIELVKLGTCIEKSDGEYGIEGHIYQELVDIPSYQGKHPILGSWVIGGEACGLGIRETSALITNDMANFVPHIIL